jgi:diaminopimelate decarboxylase
VTTSIGDRAPRLTPRLSPWVREVLASPTLLAEQVERYGSPLNLHNPVELATNVRAFQAVLDQRLDRSRVFVARKPNRCLSYVKAALAERAGIDVASLTELSQATACGAGAGDVFVTAAIKDAKLVEYVVSHEIPTAVDNIEELSVIADRAADEAREVPIAIRVSGFGRDERTYSRFGFDLRSVPALLAALSQGRFHGTRLTGFHFHLAGYSIADRVAAVRELLPLVQRARQLGLPVAFLDIGGGFPVCYLASETEWEAFHTALKEAVMGNAEPITYLNDGLCYHNHDGRLITFANLYPYYNVCSKEAALDAILMSPMGGATIAQVLNRERLELRIEPGRAAFDQAGLTLARVAHTKPGPGESRLVGLEMNFTQLLSSSVEFAVDPVHLATAPRDGCEPASCYFVGTYCMERDVILRRRIDLGATPVRGDIVAFVNTAGYMMHFLAAESHQLGRATDVVVRSVGNTYTFEPDLVAEGGPR